MCQTKYYGCIYIVLVVNLSRHYHQQQYELIDDGSSKRMMWAQTQIVVYVTTFVGQQLPAPLNAKQRHQVNWVWSRSPSVNDAIFGQLNMCM